MPPIDLSRRHYDTLIGPHDPQHPVDVAVAALPDVADIDARARAQARRMTRPEVRAVTAEWVYYDDLRNLQRCLRQERFFDAGFEHGLLAGHAQALHRSGRGVVSDVPDARARRVLGGALRNSVLASPLPLDAAIAVLLEQAYALLQEAR